MRALVVTSSPPWSILDGSSLVLENHLRRLAPRHEITVLACGARRAEQTIPPGRLAVPVEARWFGTSIPRAVDYLVRRGRSLRSREPPHVHWVERRTLVRALREEIARRPPGILHLHGWGTASLARLAQGIPAVHVAVDAWSLGADNRLLPRWRRALDRLLEGYPAAVALAHERRHYPRCAAVVVVSERDARHLRAAVPGARIEVVPNGVEPGRPPPPPPAEPVLGFHGVFQTAANRDAALLLAREIFPRVRRALPEARLLLIGRDPGREIRRLDGDGVAVTGAVEDVRPWLERVAVYVAPMVSGAGIKNKVLEAMAAGRAVVATPLALEGIGAGPGILVAATPEEVADRVLALLASRERLLEAGREARARVETEFTWQRSAEAIERLWLELSS